MEFKYPVILEASARREVLRTSSEAFFGRAFALVTSGLPMPEDGVGYVVELDPDDASRAGVLAYIDAYGRAFSFKGSFEQGPCSAPLFEIRPCFAHGGGRGYVEFRDDEGAAVTVAELSLTRFLRGGVRVSVDASAEGFSLAASNAPYATFMGLAYLDVRAALEDMAAEVTEEGAAVSLGMAKVLDRLGSGDLFSAIDGVVLEAEAAWQERPKSGRGIERYLVRMLREAGLVGKTAQDLAVDCVFGTLSQTASVQPRVRLIRTTNYANTYYVDFSFSSDSVLDDGLFRVEPAAAQARAQLIGTEGALNRFLFLSEYLSNHEEESRGESEAWCALADFLLIDNICTQAPDPNQPDDAEGRWRVHFHFARLCEGLRLPYRIGYEFHTNEACDAMGVNVLLPPLEAFPKTQWDEDAREFVDMDAAERRGMWAEYAAHACLLVALCALNPSPKIGRVSVTCLLSDANLTPVISASFTREFLRDAYDADEENNHAFRDPFAVLAAAEARFKREDDGMLSPVEPLFCLNEGEFSWVGEAWEDSEGVVLDAASREKLHVSNTIDLNIHEDWPRRALAEEVLSAMRKDSGGVCEYQIDEAALAAIKGIHDRTEDLAVRRVCKELSDEFANKPLSCVSEFEVREAFADIYGFKAPMSRAYALLRNNDDANAVRVLEELAAKIDAMPGLSDSSFLCRRYFDGYASRILYAYLCEDDCAGRRVVPLPDEVYLVHDCLAQVLANSVSNQDEALRHAQRCIELAPSRAMSYLRAARAYFMRQDFEAEARMCAKALEYSWNTEDAGLALYWAAFAFWKMGRFDAAMVSYRRCIALNSSMAEQAAVECEELIEEVKGLQRRSPDEECDLLVKEGLDAGAPERNARLLLDAAEAVTNSGAVFLGCALATSAIRIVRDDALVPTIRSLEP